MVRLRWILPSLLLAAPALAQPTGMVINPLEGGAAYEARYSQAVLIDVILASAEGPLVGEQIIIEVQADGSDDAVTLLPSPTDGTGRAVARLTLVNGRHGGATFPAAEATPDSAGQRYVIRASFAGEADDDDPACGGGDGGVVDADAGAPMLCPSEAQAELFVSLENVTLELEPGNVAALNEDMTLIATLFDENGDAPQGGTAIDDDEPKAVEDATISFFFDLDGNERPSADELLGRSDTDENGIAVLTYTVDPAIFPAGEAEQGLHVQFGGDDRYAVAGAAGRVTIASGGPDPDRCVIEIEPEDAALVADGTSQITLVGILVDEANNILGVDAPEHEVAFTSDQGTVLLEAAERDVLNGQYTQTYRVPAEGGDATIQIVIDGVPGATRVLTFEGRGCSCLATTKTPPLAWAAMLVLGGLLVRRRRSPT